MKKFYTSADIECRSGVVQFYFGVAIEGVTGVCVKAESDKASPAEYEPFRAQMTNEVNAACAGAYGAGWT